MTFSSEWDEQYRSNLQMSIWPFSDLVSYVIRYAKPAGKQTRVLELGCGAGANIPFFLAQGFKYYGIEGSNIIINKLKRKFPKTKNNLIQGDFTKQIQFKEKFDLVVDRAALTHNNIDGIKNCLELVYDKMKKNSIYIGIDWFSTKHHDYSNFVKKLDTYSRTKYSKGQFTNVGTVHFTNESHLKKIFQKFEILVLEHKIVTKKIPEKNKFAVWNFVARKIG
jgi:SAM-dependent methyltransferase